MAVSVVEGGEVSVAEEDMRKTRTMMATMEPPMQR
jgi:hypothetical protein